MKSNSERLLLLFVGVSRLDPGEQQFIKEVIESVTLKYDANRYFKKDLANLAQVVRDSKEPPLPTPFTDSIKTILKLVKFSYNSHSIY